MEKVEKDTCTIHGEECSLFCKSCNNFICIECLSSHLAKGHTSIISINEYGLGILRRYDSFPNDMNDKQNAVLESREKWIVPLLERLSAIKNRLETYIKEVDAGIFTLSSFKTKESIVQIFDQIQRNINLKTENLRSYIQSKNFSQIIKFNWEIDSYTLSFGDAEKLLAGKIIEEADSLLLDDRFHSFTNKLQELTKNISSIKNS